MQNDDLLPITSADAQPETSRQYAQFQQTPGQDHPHAKPCERESNCQGHRAEHAKEPDVGAPGPGLVGSEDVLHPVCSFVEPGFNHPLAAEVAQTGNGWSMSAAREVRIVRILFLIFFLIIFPIRGNIEIFDLVAI